MQPHRGSHCRWAAWVSVTLGLTTPWPAWANGAFPDSGQVLLPRNAPSHIYASTNFGLLLSQDEGQSWQWICEEAVGPLADLYQVGPPPANQLFAQSDAGLRFSKDGGCSWEASGGAVEDGFVVSAYPDPTNPSRVLAVSQPLTSGTPSRMALYESSDGGATFRPPLYVSPNGEVLSGVETATSDPRTIYVTMYGYGTDGILPSLAHSSDGGVTWIVRDARAALGDRTVRLIRVDPQDEKTVYLRLSDSINDALAVTHDAGQTFQVSAPLDGLMSAFLLRPNGDIIVAGRTSGMHVSHDGGLTFAPIAGSPRVRAISERDGILYATADNFADGFAVASSSDGGASWTPLMQFADICAPLECEPIRARCALPWLDLTQRFGIDAEQCLAAPAAAEPRDGCLVGPAPGRREGGVLAGLLLALVLAIRRGIQRGARA